MKVLVLNGVDPEQKEFSKFTNLINKSLQTDSIELTLVDLCSKKIGKCHGCFGCWVKTPGECIYKDDSQDICRLMANSDLLIFYTTITYGGYSSHLKKILDRSISLISPFFKKYDNEVHHRPRYNKYPSLLGIGIHKYPSDDESECFKRIIYRNSINFHAPSVYAETFLHSDEEGYIQGKLNDIVHKMEGNYHAK